MGPFSLSALLNIHFDDSFEIATATPAETHYTDRHIVHQQQ